MVQGHPTDSYFVLPNLLVKDINKQMRQGVLIKLCDECAISWDGALIRHCVTLQSELHPKINSFEMLNWVTSMLSMWFTMEKIWWKWVG